MKLFDVIFIFKAETMCSNYARPARPNSSRSWTWWAWPPSQCMSEDCKKLCRNGFRIQVSLSIPPSFFTQLQIDLKYMGSEYIPT